MIQKVIRYKSLYITIGSEENPQNNQGFYLKLMIEIILELMENKKTRRVFWVVFGHSNH